MKLWAFAALAAAITCYDIRGEKQDRDCDVPNRSVQANQSTSAIHQRAQHPQKTNTPGTPAQPATTTPTTHLLPRGVGHAVGDVLGDVGRGEEDGLLRDEADLWDGRGGYCCVTNDVCM